MVRDIRYIIKRVISAILIAICLYFLRSYLFISVKAMTVASETMSFTTSNEMVVTNVDTTAVFTTTVGYFGYYNGTSGYIRFPLSVNKVYGGNTNSIVLVHGVAITVGSTNYVCEVGNNTIENSTYNGSSYSVICPVNMVTEGMTKIYVRFTDLQSNDPSSYRVRVGNGASYEIVEGSNVQVNVDTNGIINNNTQNTQDIINNNTQNTQDMIESQQACFHIDKSSIKTDNAFLYASGTVSSNDTYGITDYISIINSKIKVAIDYTRNNDTSYCFYNTNKTLISCSRNYDLVLNSYVTIPSGANFVRFTIQKDSNRPQFEICKNGNQAIVDGQQDINNTLNDSSSVGSADIDSFFGDIDESSDTPISDLITMPLTLLAAYSSGFSGTCSSWNLGNLYGTDLVMPCIHVDDYLGSNLWHIIDLCFSLYMIYNLAMLCVMIFEDITSLRDDMLSLYTPQHAYTGYQPKHGSD